MMYFMFPRGYFSGGGGAGDDDDDDDGYSGRVIQRIPISGAASESASTSAGTSGGRGLSLNTTYVVENVKSLDCDGFAQNLLMSRFPRDVVPARLAPLETLGDGRCFLHAVSMFLTGNDYYDGKLREMIIREVNENKEFYMRTVVEAHMELFKDDEDLKDEEKKAERLAQLYDELLASCNGTNQRMQGWAGMDEAFVLANAIKRPIIVYAEKKDISTYGEGILGVGGAFLPLRHDPRDCVSKSPILVSWSTLGLHFCPVVRVRGWDQGGRFEFPKVRPALVKHVSFSGDPAANPLNESGNLSSEEEAKIEEYVDYWEPIKEPPKPEAISGDSLKDRQMKTLMQYNKPIPGFAKTRNPADKQMYDIVIPVDFGTEVEYVAFNLGEDFLPKLTKFANKLSMPRLFSLQRIMNYIIKILYYLRGSYLRSLPAESMRRGFDQEPPTAAEGKVPRLADYVPCDLIASVPRENSSVEYVVGSMNSTPKIPILVPCRFTEEISDRANAEMTEAAIARYGQESNTVIAYLYHYMDQMKQFLAPVPPDRREMVSVMIPKCDSGKLVVYDLVRITNKSFALYDILRYLALHPMLGDFFGALLLGGTRLIEIPDERDPICVHIAYVKFVANTLSTLGSVGFKEEDEFDLLNTLFEYPSFMNYLKKVCTSTVPELLIAVSVIFLNLAVVGNFSPFNVFAAEQYPRLLLSAIRMKHIPLLRNVLLGLATLLFNDCTAVSVLSKCPPMETLFEEAKKVDPDFSEYADCCWSIICFSSAE